MTNFTKNNYEVENVTIETILSWIDNGEIGLPELQRPFVWESVKVRDLVDSLYRGYPIGYIVTWNSPNIKLKNGQTSVGKKIIIDGQQRITALRAAIAGKEIITKRYERKRIKIAFNPLTEEFQTLTAPIEKDPVWVNDVAEYFNSPSQFEFLTNYRDKLKDFSEENKSQATRALEKLGTLKQNSLGNIILGAGLSIDEVTEIFNRINSKGTKLSSADFVMSKLSADKQHQGNDIRKIIDYFCQMMHDPTLYRNICKIDPDFVKTTVFSKIQWVTNDFSQVYQPKFSDLLHVCLAYGFNRGKLADLVSLVSGRDFETRKFSETAMENTYVKLSNAVIAATNQSNFERFIMILRSMGMLEHEALVVNGMGSLNFGYEMYLLLKNKADLSQSELESLVKRWIVMAALTSRYSGSSESQTEVDIKFLADNMQNIAEAINNIISQVLTNDFWQFSCPQKFATTSTQSNSWRIFEMAQVHSGDIAWLESDHKVESLIANQGNIHHIFPRAYLKKNGFSQQEYNQVANFTWLTQPRNLQVGDRAPQEYLHDAKVTEYLSEDSFKKNAIPAQVVDFTFENYEEFLSLRRQLMVQKVKEYFEKI
jgi:hypothetical protein